MQKIAKPPSPPQILLLNSRPSIQSPSKQLHLDMSWISKTTEWFQVQFSRSVVSDSLWPQGLQHARLPYLSSTPGACSNSCPLSQWCHPTISSSVVPSSSYLQSFPASGSFQMSQFASGGQNIGVSASTSVSNEYSGLISFRMDWFNLLAVHGTLKSLLQHHSSKASILQRPAFFLHPYKTTGKTIALTTALCWQSDVSAFEYAV